MGKAKTNTKTQEVNCATCGETYTPDCDYRQGRCPHHPPLVDVDKIKEKFMKQPDPQAHFLLSVVKSGVRIGAGCTLILGMFVTTGVLLIIAEAIGIAEEMV